MRYVLLLLLSGCATTGSLDRCKYAGARRLVYTSTIQAADTYAFTGQAVPYAMQLGRQAAVTALGVLDAICRVGEW